MQLSARNLPASPRSEPERVQRLQLPERAVIAGASARQADIDLIAHAPNGFLDTTHFDTVRFPPPPWAIEAFTKAAHDGRLAYSPYRGNKHVLRSLAETLSAFLGAAVDPERNLILTTGTQGALFAALAATCERGEKITLVDPDYLFYARMARFLDTDVGYVPLRYEQDDPAPDLNA